jgi:hypothetical protein
MIDVSAKLEELRILEILGESDKRSFLSIFLFFEKLS